MSKTLNLQGVFASCPTTARATPLLVTADASGKQIAYPCGNTVVVRQVEDPSKVLVCTRHSVPVTCARIAPSGFVVASGDQSGNVIIWANKDGCVTQLETKPLSGPVRDIAWTEDQERIIVVGEGRETKAVPLAANGGNTIGEIKGHSKTIISCDMRKVRPFRIATGGQDSLLCWHEGPPFKFKHSVEDKTGISGNVNCIRFSPDSSKVASVSGSNHIVICDGKTGEKLSTIPTDHTGSIYCLSWSPDGNTIATASADKSVKIYSAVDGQQIASKSFGSTVNEMQLGVVHTNAGLLSFSMNGDISVLDATSANVTGTWKGHAHRVVGLVHCAATDNLFSFGSDRKMLMWSPTGQATDVSVDSKSDMLSSVAGGKGGVILAAAGEDVLAADSGEGAAKTVLKGEAGFPVAVAALEDGHYALVYKNAVKVYNGSTKGAEVKLTGFDAACADATGNTLVVGGEKAVKIFSFSGGALEEKAAFTGSHTTQVTAVKINNAGTSVASGDSSRQIFVWGLADCKVQYEDLVYHSSRVNSVAWNADDSLMVSGSLDSSVIVWDLPNKKRVTQNNAHQGGVSAVVFSASGEVFSAGGDCCIRKWSL